MKQDKKRSRSSSSSSVSSDELNVSKDHDRSSVDSSSDSDVVEVEVEAEAKQSRKKKKHRHKHSEGDENDSSTVHEERNGKPHKHKCHHRHHHHHHHRHHGHHKHHCRSKESDERNHTKYKALRNSNDAEVVRIKQEPLDETDDSNSRMSQKSHSSRRQNERGQSSRTNGADRPRFEHHRETSNSSREREMERRRPRNEQSSETRNDDRDARRPKEERKRSGRKNRWEAEEDASNRNHPIKQEPESEGEYEWGKKANPSRDKKIPPGEKNKPNFGLSGKLTEDTNTFNGVVIKYSEPPEARKPKRRWRLYPFKGDQGLPTLYIHRQSSYLIGRDRKVADIPVDHPSCSKQHAALQYRLVPYEREDRTIGKRVRPYIIDLESSNGTFVNGVKIEARKYVEIMEKDVVKFGYSSREYVLLHEQSKDDELDDDVGANEEVPAE